MTSENPDHPAVSVFIPVRDEPTAIVGSIRAALNQDYHGDIEVIVADGSSHNDTRHAIDGVFGGDDRVVMVDNPAGSTPAGLNAALLASSGDILVRCDAHAQLPPEYVSLAIEVMASTGADVVGGKQLAVGRTAFESAVAVAMSSPMGAGGATYRTGDKPQSTDTVYLGVFRRGVFERVGLFDESLIRNQDYEFNQRVRASGGVVYFHPDLQVEYRPRSSPGDLWRQYWQYGA
ncbi:MAG: glycosyltransferase family 2 protein, partial [Acidimicrobiia bacterium]